MLSLYLCLGSEYSAWELDFFAGALYHPRVQDEEPMCSTVEVYIIATDWMTKVCVG